jgi:hypothetical protein
MALCPQRPSHTMEAHAGRERRTLPPRLLALALAASAGSRAAEEEEQIDGLTIPPEYACDVCSAIAYSIEAGFKLAEEKHRGDGPLGVPEVYDVLEKVCQVNYMTDSMGYGIRGETLPGKEGLPEPTVADQKRLVGPGLPHSFGNAEGESYGAYTAVPGKWPSRVAVRCGEIVGLVTDLSDREEAELYRIYQDAPPVQGERTRKQFAAMRQELCYEWTGDCGDGGGKQRPKEERKAKKKKKKKSKKKGKSKDDLRRSLRGDAVELPGAATNPRHAS